MMLFSPLEQFKVHSLLNISDLSISNSTLILIIGVILNIIIKLLNNNPVLIPNNSQLFLEYYYDFLLGITRENLGKNTQYFTLVFTLFSWLVFLNLIGFIPYVFSVTTHLIIALGLSLSIWLSCVILALEKHQINFFSAFMPAGTPMVLAILLVPIEILSFTARALSLGFRLCINVSSGHLLTVILADFSFKFLQAQNILFKFASVVPAGVIFALSFLEAGILVMQAFIFTTLTAIYISEAIDLH